MSEVAFSALPMFKYSFTSSDMPNVFNYDSSGTMSTVPSPSGYSTSQDSQQDLVPQDMVLELDYPSPESSDGFLHMTMTEMATSIPRLVILEQPVDKFRFRYKSEMMGTHGSILGKSSDKTRKRSYPTVKLQNYSGPAVIRCSLYTAHPDMSLRTQHTHRLVVRVDNDDKDDPHEIKVSAENHYTAVFQGMGIIHTAKKHIADELIRKKKERMLETARARNVISLSTKEEMKIREDAEIEAKRMNLNSVSLCFEAFREFPNGVLHPICEPVFSTVINNMKSALTGELKICRIDKHVSSCLGSEEVFILVEKVGKKNIKVKFFELDEEENEVWCDYGRFTELDVHHQYAIVFRTPPYRLTDIDKNVDVYLQLYRPTDGDSSEPIRFTYKPSERVGRKRQRTSINDSITQLLLKDEAFKAEKYLGDGALPGIASFDNVDTVSGISFEELLKEIGPKAYPEEFTEFMQKFSDSGSLEEYARLLPLTEPPDGTLTTDSAHRSLQNYDTKSNNFLEASVVNSLRNFSIMEKGTLKEEEIDEKLIAHNIMQEIKKNTDQKKPIFTEKILKMFHQRSQRGNSVLHAAIIHKQTSVLKTLLTILSREPRHSIVNCVNTKKQTPLHLATCSDQPELVSSLLQAGADPNPQDKDGNTPLHFAAKFKSNDCLDRLLCQDDDDARLKFDLDTKNFEGLTALHIALRVKNMYATQKLIDAGANVNEEDGYGRTALHVAVEENDSAAAKYLISKTNIDKNKRNMAGHTAANIAHVTGRKGSSELQEMLGYLQVEPQMDCSSVVITRDGEIPDLSKVKKEPEDSDELHIDEDEEEEEEEEDEDIDVTSSEMSTYKKDILTLLQKVQQSPERRVQSPVAEIKEEICVSPVSDCTTPDENEIFDSETLVKVCESLDLSGGWENLADLLDYSFLVPTIKDTESPSKHLFTYAAIQRNVTIQDIRSFLEALDEETALQAVDLMIEKQKLLSEQRS